MIKFNNLLNAAKEQEDLKVMIENDSYFTVEDEEGYRAYCQVNVYGYKYDNPDYYRGFDFSTVHRPNRKTGSGWQYMADVVINSEEEGLKALRETLERSKSKIVSGREQKDTRQPNENRKYFQ